MQIGDEFEQVVPFTLNLAFHLGPVYNKHNHKHMSGNWHGKNVAIGTYLTSGRMLSYKDCETVHTNRDNAIVSGVQIIMLSVWMGTHS